MIIENHFDDNIKYYFTKNIEPLFYKKIINFKNCAFNHKDLVIIKQSPVRSVFKFEYKKNNYYIKKYSYNRLKKQIKNIFREEEAIRNFKKSVEMINNNIDTAQPVLAFKIDNRILNKESILITKEVKGLTLKQIMKKYDKYKVYKEDIILELAKINSKLLNSNFIFRDPNANNWIIDIKANKLKIVIVDTDNIYPQLFLPQKIAIKHLGIFTAKMLTEIKDINSEILNGYSDRLLFFKEFINNYNEKINLASFIEKMNNETISRLQKRGREKYIENDEVLKKYMK